MLLKSSFETYNSHLREAQQASALLARLTDSIMPYRSFYLPSLESFEWPLKEPSKHQSLTVPTPILVSSVLEKDASGLPRDEWDCWLQWDGITDGPDLLRSTKSPGDSTYGSEACELDVFSSPDMDAPPDIFAGEALFGHDGVCVSPSSVILFPRNQHNCSNSSPVSSLREHQQEASNAYYSLSPDEEQRLREIAMPGYNLAAVAQRTEEESPDDEPAARTSARNPAKKRKTSPRVNDVISDSEMPQSCKKRGHNATEKRYRINLNSKIDALRLRIPSLSIPDKSSPPLPHEDETMADPDPTDSPLKVLAGSVGKPGKAAVLDGAVGYIVQLENSTKNLAVETAALRERVGAFEKLAAAGLVFSFSKNMEGGGR